MSKALGKSYRKDISFIELMDMFPNEEAARNWFESIVWTNGVVCPHCGSNRTSRYQKPMPHRCKTCRKFFSVRTGTIMADSPIPLRKWAIAIYLCVTNLKKRCVDETTS